MANKKKNYQLTLSLGDKKHSVRDLFRFICNLQFSRLFFKLKCLIFLGLKQTYNLVGEKWMGPDVEDEPANIEEDEKQQEHVLGNLPL